MKLLQNPLVSGVLAAAAVATVGYQFLPSNQHHGRAVPRKPSVSAPAKSTAAPRAAHAPATSASPAGPVGQDTILEPMKGIDRQYAQSHLTEWVTAPLRDPFLLLNSAESMQLSNTATNTPVAGWKLNAIWHQTGSSLAVINNRVYGPGDRIEGYTLNKIGADEVWLQGTNRVERLGFVQLGSIAVANGTQNLSSLTRK